MGCDGGTIPKRDELVRTKKKPEKAIARRYWLSKKVDGPRENNFSSYSDGFYKFLKKRGKVLQKKIKTVKVKPLEGNERWKGIKGIRVIYPEAQGKNLRKIESKKKKRKILCSELGKDKQSELSFKWGHCSITQEPLQTPIVACQLGRLYSKVAVLESLLDRTHLPDAYKHIKSIKDVKELNLTANRFYKDSDTKGDAYNDNVSPYVCPVIGLEMNGKYRFVYFWSCGCVISERALKAVSSKVCHKCQKPFSESDIIILNGTDEDVELMKQRMEERQLRLKSEKKQKKQEKASTVALINDKTGVPSTSTTTQLNVNSGEHSKQNATSKAGTKRPKEKIEIVDPDFKKTKLNYSVAKDPKATEVFKSLFTSHKSAEKLTKAHWITYNPFYN